MQQLNAAQLQRFLQEAVTPPLLLDVREPWEFAIGHIPGSRNVPMGRVPQTQSEWDPHQTVVVICHHGIRSFQVGYFLENSGFTQVINLQGGIDAWSRDVDPDVPSY
ncbi:MAG: sulfurtransferase [Gammaproteobacteria bacterium]|nr:sulfurtransferase [Gammaproteobacteria bacterium]MCP5458648.1 sulfurtransferase [Gammaproteobacteria bacterium]